MSSLSGSESGFFLIDIKGNTAIGMRRFGILIDQARFHECIAAVLELMFIFFFDTELPGGPQNCR